MSNNNHEDIDEFLGDSAPLPKPIRFPKTNTGEQKPVDPNVVEEYKTRIKEALGKCSSHHDILELKATYLAECMGIASEIYKKEPIPDNAYQLSALANAHNSVLTQLDRMNDPKELLGNIEVKIKEMFTTVIKALMIEVEKTKREFSISHPEDRATIDDYFTRMLSAIQPETQKIYDGFQNTLKTILGIKK